MPKTRKPPAVKGELIQIRVTVTQKAKFQAAAEKDRRRLSDWVRLAAEAAADQA